jgi:Domain of unknown function (DUF222)/HNH endonuclease
VNEITPANPTALRSTTFTALTTEALEDQITELAGHLNAANHRWLTLIAEFDRRHGWAGAGLISCAHWLNFKCGLNMGAARERVRVAHALPGLPKIAASMARGELSYSKVRALTRIACPATEESLLMMALHGTAHHVETLVRHYRRAEHVEQMAREERQEKNCSFRFWHDSDGSVVFQGRMPALAGELFLKALNAAIDAVPATEPLSPVKHPFEWAKAAADPEKDVDRALRPYPARRADALALMAECFLKHGATDSAPTQSSAERYQVVIHVDAATLKDRSDGRCEVEHGSALSVDTVRRLSCDASLTRVDENGRGEILNVGRKTRTLPPALRRALNARDSGCRFPGCTFHRYTDAHHVKHWADGGETKLSNLVTLCRAHHRMVHSGEIFIETTVDGGWRFLNQAGIPYKGAYRSDAPVYAPEDLRSVHDECNLKITPRTAATRWAGERMDYGLALQGLFSQRDAGARRAHLDVSAETPRGGA